MNLLWAGASASVLILALICLRLMLVKRLPKGFFAALWWIPLVRLLLPFELPSLGSLAQQSAPIRELVQASPMGAMLETPAQNGIRVALEPVTQEMERQAAAAPGMPLWQAVWAAGTVLVLAYVVISTVRGYRKFATALPEQSPQVVQWLSARKMNRRVRIRQSDRIDVPMAYGVFRPVVLLPKGFAQRESMVLAPVLNHEMAHIRRFDPLAKLLQWAALALHWWNPLVWGMVLLWGRDMELACDQCALKECGKENRADFARTLLALSQGRQMQPVTPYALSFSKYALEERIQQMMKPKKISIASLLVAVLAALFALTMAGTAETEPINEWLERARQSMAEVQVIDWETTTDESLEELFSKEVDGVMMFRPMHEDTWKTFEELLADKEDGYYILTYEEVKEQYENQMAHIQALADNGAHFWIVGEGWVDDPQEAVEIMRETRQRHLSEYPQYFRFTVLEDGQTEEEWQWVDREYWEVQENDLQVVLEFSPGDCMSYSHSPTPDKLRDRLLEDCLFAIEYTVMTQEQANDILSADFLY